MVIPNPICSFPGASPQSLSGTTAQARPPAAVQSRPKKFFFMGRSVYMGVLTIARGCVCVCVGHRDGCLYEAGPPGGDPTGRVPARRPGPTAACRGRPPRAPCWPGGVLHSFYIAFTTKNGKHM